MLKRDSKNECPLMLEERDVRHSMKECNLRGKQLFMHSKEEATLKRKKKEESPPIPKEEKVGTKKTKENKSSGIFFKGERSSFWRSINSVHFHTICSGCTKHSLYRRPLFL